MVLVGRRLVQRVCKGVEAFRRSGGELWREQEDGGDLVKASRANPTADPTRDGEPEGGGGRRPPRARRRGRARRPAPKKKNKVGRTRQRGVLRRGGGARATRGVRARRRLLPEGLVELLDAGGSRDGVGDASLRQPRLVDRVREGADLPHAHTRNCVTDLA